MWGTHGTQFNLYMYCTGCRGSNWARKSNRDVDFNGFVYGFLGLVFLSFVVRLIRAIRFLSVCVYNIYVRFTNAVEISLSSCSIKLLLLTIFGSFHEKSHYINKSASSIKRNKKCFSAINNGGGGDRKQRQWAMILEFGNGKFAGSTKCKALAMLISF